MLTFMKSHFLTYAFANFVALDKKDYCTNIQKEVQNMELKAKIVKKACTQG